MLFGGMITSNPLFLFLIIPTLVIVFILALVNGELIYNILVYGKFSEPCVWVSDYVSFGGNMGDLLYDKELECYVIK